MMKFDKAVIIVGQGEVHEALLKQMAPHYPLIALDGGVKKLVSLGLEADVIIGDMDSCPDDLKAKLADKIIPLSEQDSNDLEKALYSLDAPLFIGFGLLGGRFDQVMANLHGLVKYQLQKKLIMISPYEILCCVKGAVRLSLPAGIGCAILPIKPICFAQSSGLRWPIDGLRLEIGQLISSSNHCEETPISLTPCDEDKDIPYLISCDSAVADDIISYFLGI